MKPMVEKKHQSRMTMMKTRMTMKKMVETRKKTRPQVIMKKPLAHFNEKLSY